MLATRGKQAPDNRHNHLSRGEAAERKFRRSGVLGKIRVYLKMLGPGLITGASDADPSGIGTYCQAGAQFGFLQLWTSLFSFPLMVAIQEICARMAMQTGNSLTETIRKNYPKPVLYFCVALLFIANTVNLGADLGAMAAAMQLLVGLPFVVWLVVITLLGVLLQVFLDYRRYAQVLRYLTLALFTYVLVFFVTPVGGKDLLLNTLLPTLRFDRQYLLAIVAIFGTTISPYLFFWQTNLELEERIAVGKGRGAARGEVSRVELKWMRADVMTGMLLSNLIMWFIMATAAASFFRHGIHRIDTAYQAAKMLEPLAGRFASLLFAVGIVGTGLLAVPIFAGSAAYAVAESFRMRKGLCRNLREAPGFYAIIVLATAIGFLMDLTGIDAIKALYYAAVLNGLAAPPLLLMVMLISGNGAIMKDKVNSPLSAALGWITTAGMTLAALALLGSVWSGGS
jgi:NRAMP (natural resistance-associated macrophage protein)-like metal ion transporter